MLEGLSLGVAVVGLLVAVLALLLALYAVGLAATTKAQQERTAVSVASLEGHRARFDENFLVVTRALQTIAPRVVLAREPERPQ